jgi:hypothetical protein
MIRPYRLRIAPSSPERIAYLLTRLARNACLWRGARLLLRWNNRAIAMRTGALRHSEHFTFVEMYQILWRCQYNAQSWPGDDVARGQREDE